MFPPFKEFEFHLGDQCFLSIKSPWGVYDEVQKSGFTMIKKKDKNIICLGIWAFFSQEKVLNYHHFLKGTSDLPNRE